ncbi:AAA-domain-containing protein [Pholiota conissans]|uniref:AAA-domain-containing protein n=1 Tax=Pholiota conissans TaxID=109636 RepID=A0A9P6CYC0_9AGAR|nr:AAA-domain-containing protein [Pholiota conissans]
MRSQSFLRKSHSLLKSSALVHPIIPLPVSVSRSLNKSILLAPKNGPPVTRLLSTNVTPPSESEEAAINTSLPEPSPPDALEPVEQATGEEPDKTTTRTRRSRTSGSSSTKDVDPVEFPLGFENDVLYVPTQTLLDSRPGGLPPAEIFEEALDNLLITLHPQNQQRSLIPSAGSTKPVEPTLGLYCPIEGGDYILDLTVHELAYQTGAEVLILDAVHLAAGEWGPFGKAASALNLPNNPLHFSAPPTPSAESSNDQGASEEADEGDSPFMFTPSGRMSVSLPKGLSPFLGRSLISQMSRKSSPSKLDAFFETLVNMPIPTAESAGSENKPRPRLIFIRDFPTLARSSSLWYPSLLSAVKQRRRGMLSRSNLGAAPVTIIFGMTPSVTPPINDSSSGPSNSLMSLLMNRNSSGSQISASRKQEHVGDWGEGEAADTAREKRLRARLRKWEKSTAGIHDEFPSLTLRSEDNDISSSSANIIVIGGSEATSSPNLGIGIVEPSADSNSQFFRSTILVPRTRSTAAEKETRIARRREINELTMRMGVGAVGGIVENIPAFVILANTPEAPIPTEDASITPPITKQLWEDWGNKVEIWANVRKVADRAMGSIMVKQRSLALSQQLSTSDSTTVPWSAVQKAWLSYQTMISARKTWLKEAIGHLPIGEEAAEGKDDLSHAGSSTDKVVEAIKNDSDLDQHESRLLSCIIDSGSIPTTFKQVHLQPHTIDAVRTIVSLPLLHPHAFQQGILKEHSMTGCLLFGPPGTGKTLLVRALAKEAGCRMLAISPSDVMDMYVGEGEKLVKAVFSLARRLSPCVVFLDEIDALFGARVSARETGSAIAHRGVITEFMQEMDGLKSSKEDNVIVIGATNRPFDLDDAVLRRLPRRLLVDLPGEKERLGILKILLRDETLADDVDIEALAKKTEGFSGSDLKHLCVSAALDSVKEHTQLPWASRHIGAQASLPDTAGPVDVSVINASHSTLSKDSEAVPSGAEVIAEKTTTDSTDASIPTEVPAPEATTEETSLPPVDASPPTAPEVPMPARILRSNNFTQALKEITPSSSETLGSLAELRKWNEEFGEGRRDRKKRQVWGKGRFGFINSNKDISAPEEGKVAKEQSSI